MKNKTSNLFNNPQKVILNQGVKYSKLLENLLEPFVKDFEDELSYEEIFEFVIFAWNSANIKVLLPKEKNNDVFDTLEKEGLNVALFNKMIDHKISHFKNYTHFIVDYEVVRTLEYPILRVFTQEQDAYLKAKFEQPDTEDSEDDLEENFVNRSAIIIKPLQPFIDWCSGLYPGNIEDIKETTTYLISEDIEDIESWLSKKFDKLFTFELNSWHTNKKEWPQKRNYKMFKEWFQIDTSTTVFDFEINPIQKY